MMATQVRPTRWNECGVRTYPLDGIMDTVICEEIREERGESGSVLYADATARIELPDGRWCEARTTIVFDDGWQKD